MSSSTPSVTAQIEAAVEDPATRERLIQAFQRVGGTSLRARILKAVAFFAGALMSLTLMPFDGASVAIATAFATAGIAEVSG